MDTSWSPVPWVKGYGRAFVFQGAFEITPLTRVARFLHYPDDHRVGIFENGTVRIEHAEDGSVVAESRNHRRTFDGFARCRRWSVLDALYFFGYALTHYHAVPFTLSEGRLVSATRSGSGSAALDILTIEFPSDVPTHRPRQRFYIDARGRIVRHDYHSQIIGFLARDAHFGDARHSAAASPSRSSAMCPCDAAQFHYATNGRAFPSVIQCPRCTIDAELSGQGVSYDSARPSCGVPSAGGTGTARASDVPDVVARVCATHVACSSERSSSA